MSQVNGLIKMMEETKKEDAVKSSSHKTKVISVVSGKGGVGKSNITTNLALLFGNLGKRVLLLDADLGLANINILLGLIPRFTLLDVIKGTKTLNEIIISYNKNVDFIPGATGFHQLADLDMEKQKALLQSLINLPHYDVILIDGGAGISQNVVAFVSVADEVLVVTTPEPTALTDAYGMVKVIAAKSNRTDAQLLINMVQDEVQGLKVYQKLSSVCHRFLMFKLNNLGYVMDDINIKKAVQQQKPIILSYPNSKASQNLREILTKLEALDPDDANNKGNGVTGLFKKIFSLYQ